MSPTISNKLGLNISRANQALLTKRRTELLKRPTVAELHVKSLLDELDEAYIFNKGFYTTNRFFIVDFYIKRRHRLCLEIDGKYHEDRVAYDEGRDWFLKTVRNVRVVRLKNEFALRLDATTLDVLMELPAGTPWQEALPVREP